MLLLRPASSWWEVGEVQRVRRRSSGQARPLEGRWMLPLWPASSWWEAGGAGGSLAQCRVSSPVAPFLVRVMVPDEARKDADRGATVTTDPTGFL